mmetsp:Transcript_36108/g.79054  ORF Transcript_36108/g.79054 Transcript_36108/m.79054 type:complete len:168 (-) Transcript_36108:1593-2096(-)
MKLAQIILFLTAAALVKGSELRGRRRRAKAEPNSTVDDGLENGTGAGTVRGVGTNTLSVCPICSCFQPCHIITNMFVVGDNVSEETIQALLRGQAQVQAQDNEALKTILGGQTPEGMGDETEVGDGNSQADTPQIERDNEVSASASSACEQQCRIQCSSNCGGRPGT